MVLERKQLQRRALTRGTYRVFVGRADCIRLDGRTVRGPCVLRVSRTRVEVYPVSALRAVHT